MLYKMIQDIRNYKVSNKLAPNYKLRFIIETNDKLFDELSLYLGRFSFAKELVIASKASSKGIKYVYNNANLYVEDDISDEEKEAKKAKDIAFLEAEIKRGEMMLNNPNFISKAPKEKVDLERKKLEDNKAKLAQIK